jgi:hypothetical protein
VVEKVIQHIVLQAELQMKEWQARFRENSIAIGMAHLYGGPEPDVSFALLYERYMVAKQVGQLEAFRDYYQTTREKQAKMLTSEGPLSNPVYLRQDAPEEQIERLKALLASIAGFFLTETRLAWDGFTLIPQTKLDEIWRNTLSAACVQMHNLTQQMMALSRQITLFCEKMDFLSMSCAAFQQFLSMQVRPFKTELMREFQSQVRKIIEENSMQLVTFMTPDEYAKVSRFALCETPTRYPYDAKFVPSIPMVLEKIEKALEQWGEFSGKTGDRAFIETYEGLMSNAVGQLGSVGLSITQIPNVGFFIASMISLQAVLPFFDQWIQQLSAGALRPDKDKIRRKFQEQQDALLEHIKVLFRGIVGELILPQTFRTMTDGKPPHNFSFELVTYLETMSTTLRPLLPAGMFLKIIENVAAAIAEKFAEVIVTTTDLKWNAEMVWKAQQNLHNIENWPTLIALPSAKQQLNGLSTMFAKLLSTQLSAFAGDPQFIQACRSLPVEAMHAILSRYSQTKSKEYYTIPSSLVKQLLGKLAPQVKHVQAGKGKR